MEFTRDDILNELGRVFRGRLEKSESDGQTDPVRTFSQLQEIAAHTLITDRGTAYYLASLSRNRISTSNTQAVAFIEDMLASLAYLTRAPRNNPLAAKAGLPNLVDAQTALLNLEGSTSINDRPEAKQLQRSIDRFTQRLRTNVVGTNEFTQPTPEARKHLRANLASLKTAVATLTSRLPRLRDIMEEFQGLDLPSRVAATALPSVRTNLAAMSDEIAAGANDELLEKSRVHVLRTITSKVAVGILDGFESPDPSKAKLTSAGGGTAAKGLAGSPGGGLGKGGPFNATALGNGVAAEALSLPGPFPLELSTDTLSFRVQGDTVDQDIDLAFLEGPTLTAGNVPPFLHAQVRPAKTPGSPPDYYVTHDEFEERTNLHLAIDPRMHEFQVAKFNGSLATNPTNLALAPPMKLGFRHLGSVFQIHDLTGWTLDTVPTSGPGPVTIEEAPDLWADALETKRWNHILKPRVVIELGPLAAVTLVHVPGGSGNNYTVSVGTMQAWYDGFYVKTAGGARYEIIKTGATVIVDTRDAAPGSAAGAVTVYGSSGTSNIVEVSPALYGDVDITNFVLVPDTGIKATIGPTIKSAWLPELPGAADYNTITEVVDELNDPTNNNLSLNQDYAHAHYHFIFKAHHDGSNRLVIQTRSRDARNVVVTDKFSGAQDILQTGSGVNNDFVQYPGPFPRTSERESVHAVLGFSVNDEPGEARYFSIEDMVELINAQAVGATADAVETDLATGTLEVQATTKNLQDAATDFAALTVQTGDRVEITSGLSKRTYYIDSVSTITLTVDVEMEFVSTELVSYRVFRTELRIRTDSVAPGNSLQIVSGPTELGFTVGTTYGAVPSAEFKNAAGEVLDVSKLSVGDTFGSYVIKAVAAASVVVDGDAPSDLDEPHDVFGALEAAYRLMSTGLTSLLTDKIYLAGPNFVEGLDPLDRALTAVLTAGVATSQADLKRSTDILDEMLAVLKSTPTSGALNVTDVLAAYAAPVVPSVDQLVSSYQERGYDRGAAMLASGQFTEFFALDLEAASFSGNLMKLARTAIGDLPKRPQAQDQFEADIAASLFQDTDPDGEIVLDEDEEGQL